MPVIHSLFGSASELTVYEIARDQCLMLGTRTLVSRKPLHTSSSHQKLDTAVLHVRTVTKDEFGVNPAGTVGAVRGGVSLGDQLR